MTDLIKPALRWLRFRKHWLGLIVAYVLILIGTYSAIWLFIEPMGIPDTIDTLDELPGLLRKRVFLHLMLTLVIAAHITLVLDLIFGLKMKRLLVRQGVKGDKRKVAMVLGAGETGVKVIRALVQMGLSIEGVYDKNPNAAGVRLAQTMRLPLYVGDATQLPKMLKECERNPDTTYHLFLASEFPGFVDLVDGKARSLRRRTKNFRLLRLGIDFDEEVTPDEIQYL